MNTAATGVTVERVRPPDAPAAAALLDLLRVSLFGVQSSRLHRALVADGITQRIDCRLARSAAGVCGIVLAAPRAYWTSALLTHPALAAECVRARLFNRAHPDANASSPPPQASHHGFDSAVPPRTWADPGDAWRIIFVGTAASARGRGVAAELYRSMMRDRSLVARIAPDNDASIRLHRSVGWRLYRDGQVVLAVHQREPAS